MSNYFIYFLLKYKMEVEFGLKISIYLPDLPVNFFFLGGS